jgi:hypothetical protein
MAASSQDQQFSWADIARWTVQGLITAAQADAIRLYVDSLGQNAEQRLAGPEQRPGLNLITIAYYFGAFMILLAYTIFVGLQWQELGSTGQLLITTGTLAFLGAIGYLLRRGGFVLAGNLLLFAAAGIVPLLVYTIQRAAGLWPDQETLAYADFYRLIRSQWVVMEIVSIVAALVMVGLTRFPLMVLLVAFWCWFLSMDLVRLISDSPSWTWGDNERTIGMLMGFAMLGAGIFLQRFARKDYSFWLYLFGHIIVLSHLSSLACDHVGAIGLVFLIVYLAFVVASVWLQRRVFLVFGALGCYSYASYLAFQVFDGVLGFTFALAGIGLLIVGTAVGYQKYLRGWLEQQLGQYRTSATTQQ